MTERAQDSFSILSNMDAEWFKFRMIELHMREYVGTLALEIEQSDESAVLSTLVKRKQDRRIDWRGVSRQHMIVHQAAIPKLVVRNNLKICRVGCCRHQEEDKCVTCAIENAIGHSRHTIGVHGLHS